MMREGFETQAGASGITTKCSIADVSTADEWSLIHSARVPELIGEVSSLAPLKKLPNCYPDCLACDLEQVLVPCTVMSDLVE